MTTFTQKYQQIIKDNDLDVIVKLNQIEKRVTFDALAHMGDYYQQRPEIYNYLIKYFENIKHLLIKSTIIHKNISMFNNLLNLFLITDKLKSSIMGDLINNFFKTRS